MISRTLALLGALAAPLLFYGAANAQNVALSPLPMQRFVDNNGNALSGGKLFTYSAGTTTKLATYVDSTGATANTDPIILNSRGEAQVWLNPALVYKYVLSPATDTDPPSNPIWTIDQINTSGSTGTCNSITAFGGKGDNVTDNTTAFNTAMSTLSAISQNVCLYFPSGKYKFNSAISYTYPADRASLTIKGDGVDVTELTWPTSVSSAMTLNFVGFTDTVHVRDMTFSTGTNNVDKGLVLNQQATSGVAVASGQIQSDFTNLLFRSNEGVFEQIGPATTHGWLSGIITTNVSDLLFNNVMAFGPSNQLVSGIYAGQNSGSGVTIRGNSATVVPVIFNFTNCNFTWLTNGILIGSYIQGVTISQSNFVGNAAGVGVPSSEPGLDQLAITTSQFNNQNDLFILSIFSNVQVTNSLFITQPGHSGTKTAINYPLPGSYTTITGNSFNGAGSGDLNNAISLNGGVTPDSGPAVITGNSLNSWATAITLGNNVIGAKVGNNVYTSNGTNVSNYIGNGLSNIITGLPLAFANVSGVANNGSGIVRLTVNSTSSFVTGEMASIGGIGGVVTANVVTPVTVIDATHFDLPQVSWTGLVYTGGGIVSAMP